MIQRYVCAGSVARGRGVVVLSGFVNAGLGFLFMLLGVALFAFYTQPTGAGLPELPSDDQILPHFLSTQAAGVGLVGLMLAGLFAAAMSTIDSGINGVASVVVYDWLGGRELPVRTSRVLTVVLGSLVIVAAFLAPLLGEDVISMIMTIAGTMLGGLLAVFLLGMFVPRANGAGALVGLAAGVACVLVVVLATDIRGWWSIPRWWYGAFVVFPTLLVGVPASYLFPPPSQDARAALFWNSSPRDARE
jgi:SSS family solute:Na+ symporter